MDNQFYVHLNSNDSLNYFYTNKPWCFTTILPETLHLNGRWYVGLAECEYTHKFTKQNRPFHLTVSTNICKDSIIGTRKHQLLRYIPFLHKSGQRVFEKLGPIHYYLVNKQEIERIEIPINAPDFKVEEVLGDQAVKCTLHFTRAPPFVL